ncbi:L(+)-tartrate dehydratase subunit alpha [Limihaloglobus sulfuriphilus]|uniref:L(+)-tartrate dehydratase subunit alpha n=1 Tax=Limihaloglobus sulfuriphilus TaxID=1851148 RepID=A0A1Q2MD43_9BACT|nr:fumarate hydratase [Limihaloglobus sulfuriphilus]AQQ70458.1 L(+)-tartrate dehydratase subunit alpha [Limihaloglobus sulfuriphilus]
MKQICYNEIRSAVCRACIDSAYLLSKDVREALERSLKSETSPKARGVISQLIHNADIASHKQLPLCQDTGLTVVFVQHGSQVMFKPPDENPVLSIFDAINHGVEDGYSKGYLRKSVVADPLNKRVNTGTNTPAIIHYSITSGSELSISLMLKGGGCENKSMFKMFNPTESPERIIDWISRTVIEAGANACPPFVVGVGIGGDFEQCCMISKRALLRNLKDSNPDRFYADMESIILKRVNSSGVGPLGFGGDTTALGVNIETAPCHIASLPVAVNIECHSHRHKRILL